MGNDSFMDVICNMVGIIIILIMVSGIRSARAPRIEAPDAPNPTVVDLRDLIARARSLEEDVVQLNAEVEQVQLASAVKFEERRLFALQVAQGREQIEAERQKLGAAQRADFELQRAAAAAEVESQRLDQALSSLANTEKTAVKVVSYPTPISKVVNGKEVHFQLRGGHVACVPIEKLLDRLPNEMRRQRDKLMNSYEVTSTAGPVDGFRMRYTLERDGNYIRLYECQFLPVTPQIGEPLEMALAPNSEFRRALAVHNPRATTVTLWTYPDSFDAYRRLKAELYQMGYSIAGRPLPNDQPIGGSPNGSKSAAE
jgi:hypothetical protein